MESLGLLFGSLARVKLLRLFLFNHTDAYSFDDVIMRAKLSSNDARAELLRLVRAGLLKRSGTVKASTYRVNQRYPYLDALSAFIRSTTVVAPAALVRNLKKAGALRLVVLSGVFTGVSESSIDLLVVGDKLDERALARAAQVIEAELGREIRYASFGTEDFAYRRGIYDRLLRDVFDYPHQSLLDRIGL
jgi:predicted nucleotidyltransferase